ncbi:MAG: hypothetical protein ACKOD2_10275 [Ilumatobacteraceae bacterium]
MGVSSVDTIRNVEKLSFADKTVVLVNKPVSGSTANVGSEYTTIAQGIAAANTGDVVLVAAGDYSAEGTVTINNKVLTVLGPQKGLSPNTNAAAWATAADLAVVGRFYVMGTGGLSVDGLRLVGASGVSDGNADSAVILLGTGGLSVANSLISVAATGDQYPTGLDIGYDAGNSAITVTGSLFKGFTAERAAKRGYGIYLNYNASITRDVQITDNVFDMAGDIGSLNGDIPGRILAFDGYSSARGALVVQENQFLNSAPQSAIIAFDTANILTSATDFSGISDNTFTNCTGQLPASNAGVFRNFTAYNTTTGSNTIDGATFDQILTGPEEQASTLTGSSGPDYIAGQGLNDVISGLAGNDVLLGNTGDDTLSGGAGTNTIDGGTGIDTAVFPGSRSDYDIFYGDSTITVTSKTGVTPVIADTLSNIEILSFEDDTGRTLFVGPGTVFATIQAAIDAAQEHDTILVYAGSYAGPINIDVENVTLQSLSGAAATTITGAAAATGETVRISANGVVFGGSGAGFTIDNGNAADGRAIAPTNSNGAVISGPTIVNAFRGIQGDFHGRPTNITITGNTFSSSVSYGLASTEGMSIAALSGNTFNTSVEGIGLGEDVSVSGYELNSTGIFSLLGAQTVALTGGYVLKDYPTNSIDDPERT